LEIYVSWFDLLNAVVAVADVANILGIVFQNYIEATFAKQ
jgi:hypothetical protein